ncbi:DUF5710 domain-containing protein [Massilia sp. R798]|uniref:DUF5710 domain-containing protein n=1 Tax=Massilia soli TaxID=2792854 RepID=A0ABS7SKK3_9BURK|nr:zincin-like metallopeptidase domain-containing protein [Massilia soli]MBZ2206562.1 DUF5710 domain-containing protein [Massilia soli]
MKNDQKPFYETVAEKLIEQLREGTAPWQKPWEPGEVGAFMPINPTTGKRYRGINALQLMSEGRSDQRWLTYKQAEGLDAQVRKGEKGTPIQYWKFTDEQNKMVDGKQVFDNRGEPVKETVMLERPRVFLATVFNAEQIDGLPPLAPRMEQRWSAQENAEQILRASGATFRQGEHDRAFYRPSSDSIHLPAREQFATADNYYATALHELGHWTGHSTRLNRDLAHPFGSEGYAKEELRAEIASMILGDELGIGHDPKQHAAYVGSWIKALQDDPLEIFRAAADAEKIQEYIMGLTQKQIERENLDIASNLREIRNAYIRSAAVDQARHTFAAEVTALEKLDAAIDAGLAEAVSIPPEWTGGTQILGMIEDNVEAKSDQIPSYYRLTGERPDGSYETMADYLELANANELEARLREIHQLAESVQLARQPIMPPADDSKALAGATSADRAEAWTLARIDTGKLARSLDGATLAQLQRVHTIFADMEPLSADTNSFWQRHELPRDVPALADQIESAKKLVTVRQSDAVVAAARLDLVSGEAVDRERLGAALDREAKGNLGFVLPHDWTGRTYVRGNVTEEVDGKLIVSMAEAKGVEAESWGVYAQVSDGLYEFLDDRPTEQLADDLAERLAVIDARSTVSEHEKAAKLARINEQRVRRNPDSTDEDISAAKEARKNAEFVASTNDAELQRRIELEELQRTQQAAPVDAHKAAPKNLISVPYKEKEEAKAKGAKWDRNEQSWYVPQNIDPAPFAKWARKPSQRAPGEAQAPAAAEAQPSAAKAAEGRIYLAVPYSERMDAKAAGAVWDKVAKSWYAGPDADMAKLDKWKPENVPAQQTPAMTPKEEFAEALTSIGCIISGEHPVLDGKPHRISVEGEKFSKNSGSGFYVGHMDGHPAGYMKNNKTGEELTWKSKGYTLSAEDRAQLAAEAAQKLQQREAHQSQLQEQAAKRVATQLRKLDPVEHATPYMLAKGIEPQAGAFTDKDGKKTYLPAVDVDGKQWTMQYIQANGTKRFAKDSRKEGCFHVVGGDLDDLAKAPAIVVGEGYATMSDVTRSLGFATVSAFDSGNLIQVAQALHQKFPGKPMVIAGDDDRHLELTLGVNPGRTKAEEAADLVGGKALLPVFAPGEASYPAGLDPVTPDSYREHQKTGNTLSGEQLAAIEQMKRHTDFNDVANRSALGREGVDRQVRSFVDVVIAKHHGVQVDQLQPLDQMDVQQQEQTKVQPLQDDKPKRQRKVAKVA